jgi:site-specific recombinase XerD
MQFLNRDELRRLFQVAYDHNRLHHLCLVTMFWSGLRVSEALAIRGRDICDCQLSVKRLKKSKPTIHALKMTADPLFDQSPLLEMAKRNPLGRLFPWCRQNVDYFVKKYGAEAGIHPAKLHSHVAKHSICVLLWEEKHDLNVVQDHVGHRAPSSSLAYMRTDAVAKAQQTVAGLSI